MSEPNQRDGAPEQQTGGGEGGGPLPSIIIDPSLTADVEKEPAPAATELAQPDATAAPPPAADPAPEPTPVTAAPDPNIAPPPPGFMELEGDLSLADAEHFASSYRPSWEPALPVVEGGSAVAESSTAAPSIPVPAAPSDDELPLPQLSVQRAKQRATLMALGAVAFFGLMLVLALRSSSPDQPIDESTATTTDTAPVPKAAQAPVPTPSPAPPAVPPAPAPTAPTTPPTAPIVTAVAPAAPENEAAAAVVPTPTAPPQPEPVAAAEPVAMAAPAPEPAPERRSIRLRVRTSPALAKLTLDGAPVANPFDATVPKGGKHDLEASAVGHRSFKKRVTFDRDQAHELRLKPETARRSSPASRPERAAPIAPERAPEPPVVTIEKEAPKKTKGAAFVADSPY